MGNRVTRYDPFEDLFRGLFVRPVNFGTAREAPTVKVDVKEQDGATALVFRCRRGG